MTETQTTPTTSSTPQGDAPLPATATKAKPGRAPAAPGAALQVLEQLFQLYPKMFGARFLPLKLGVYQELLAAHPDAFKKEDLKAALGLHARSTRYLESIAAGHKRHDLHAQPVEDVAPEHVHHAIMEVFRRRQVRSKHDLKPWLRERLVQAIESSGLERSAYVERVRASDDFAAAALQDAFEQLALQAARREALLRAFHASAKPVDEFAAMYGISPAAVHEALARNSASAVTQ